MSIRVILTDDHKMIREGIKQLLEFDGSIQVVAEAGNGKDCIALLQKNDGNIVADVVLLDINMPIMNGLETLRKIRELQIPVRVIILSVHTDVEYVLSATEAGADGYVLKDADSEELKEAIFDVFQGQTHIQKNLIPLVNAKLVHRNIDRTKIESLTKREMEVLKLVGQGMYNKQIADTLFISERTVKNHLSKIFIKLEMNDRTQAAIFAIRNSLVRI